MSEPKPHNEPCEQLLDYVYEALDEPGKLAFEQHLATCARCQAEAASFGKVRAATARLLPVVEPPSALTGALHAQLMHAAAQRKPKRGALLSFPRKIVQHPAWAAAAMFVIVGGAFTLNAVRGRVMMPVRELQAAAPRPLPTEAELKLVPAPAEPGKGNAATLAGGSPSAAAPAPALEKHKKSAPAKSAAYDDVQLNAPPIGMLKVAPAPPAARHSAALAPQASKPAQSSAGKRDSADSLFGDAPGEGDGRAAGGGFASKDEKQSAAMPTPAAEPVAKEEERSIPSGGGGVVGGAMAYDKAAPAASPAPPPAAPAVASAPEPEVLMSTPRRRGSKPTVAAARPPVSSSLQQQATTQGYGKNGYGDGSLPAPQTVAAPREAIDLHQRADDLVRANRCDDAVKVYAELDRRAQRMSPKERANYVRCLTATGRQQQAEQQLDELKADKSVTNGLVQKAQDDVDSARRSEAKKAASRKSAPSDDRAPPQQQRVDEPAAPVPTAAPPRK